MAFYTMTFNSERPAKAFTDWLKEKMVLNGWEAVENVEVQPPGLNTSGTVTSASANSLTKTGSGWVSSAYTNYSVTITGGTGSGQTRTIVNSTSTVLTVSANWNVIPDATSTYRIDPHVTEVLRSPASNSLGVEFYTYLSRQTEIQSWVYFTISEQWDAINKKKLKYAPSTGIGTAGSDFSINDSGVATNTNTGDGLTIVPGLLLAGDWVLTVDQNHVVLGRTSGSGGNYSSFGYIGIFDRLLPSSLDVMPIIATNSHYSGSIVGSSTGRCTRDPGLTPGQTYSQSSAWTAWFGSSSSGDNFHYAYVPCVSTASLLASAKGVPNPYTGAINPAARVQFTTGRGNGYFPRGLLRDVVTCAQGATPGDTLAVTMNGVTKNYVLVSVPLGGAPIQLYIPSE